MDAQDAQCTQTAATSVVEQDEAWELMCGIATDGFDGVNWESDTEIDAAKDGSVTAPATPSCSSVGGILSMPEKLVHARFASAGRSPVEIRQTADSGKGLFATRRIASGEVIFTESSSYCIQMLKTPEYSTVAACDTCLRSLATPEDVCSDGLPSPEVWPQFDRTHCSQCDGAVVYCCKWCKDKGFETHHRLLCHVPGSLPLSLFEQWVNDHAASFSSSAMSAVRLALKMAAQILQEIETHTDAKEQALLTQTLLDMLVGDSSDATRRFCVSEDDIVSLLSAIRCVLNLTSLDDAVWLNVEWLKHTIMCVSQNAVHMKPAAPFATWYSSAKRRGEFGGGADVVRKAVEGLIAQHGLAGKMHEADEMFRQLCGIEAIGLFALHTCINHSCDSNCEAQTYCYSTAALDVVALRTIEAGEEITISYIDKKLPVFQRRARLRRHYLFDCHCGKCLSEM